MEQNVQNPELAELAKQLPLKLRRNFRIEVVRMAIDENFIQLTDDGRMVWLMGSKTLLAYFCGRMWCGDETVKVRFSHKKIWKKGGRHFPEKDIEWLFGEKNLRQIRFEKINMKIPENSELIDNLFVTQQIERK